MRRTRACCEDDDEGSLAACGNETREADQSACADDITSTLDTAPHTQPNALKNNMYLQCFK